MAAAVVIPVKAFSRAKARLAEVLSPAERADLARAMATTVVRAAGPLPVLVVCDDEEVRTWAEGLDVEVLWTPDLGLDGAVAAGVDHVGATGSVQAVVSHADLPLAVDLSWVAEGDPEAVTLVPDRHGDGTNVLCLPTGRGFAFAYGAASCARHEAEARRLGLPVRVVPDPLLGWDVDRPADLRPPAELLAGRPALITDHHPEGAPCP